LGESKNRYIYITTYYKLLKRKVSKSGEDNRLQAIKDKHMGAFYNYDAAGERNLKLNGGTMDVTQNGTTVNVPVLDQQTLYASSLVTVNDKGYTKHYFEEDKRICSKIGGGNLQDVDKLVIPLSKDIPYLIEYANSLIDKTFGSCMHLVPKIKNNDLYSKTIKTYTGQIYSNESAFYYHGDHLGSASYITGDNGLATQCLAYMPTGEDFVDIKYNTTQFETPYKFNGKEKDEETGNNYYGARYLNNDLSIFLSTDPMSDKYPHLSSYNYCANNPVMLIDPDGRDVVVTGEAADKSVEQMQTKNLKIDRDSKSGLLSYKGIAKTKTEKMMVEAMDNPDVKVSMEANYSDRIDGDKIDHKGGAFMGTTLVTENGKTTVIARQIVNPQMLEDKDIYGDKGQAMKHELTEAYQGGLISLKENRPIPIGIKKNETKGYLDAHNAASPQPSKSFFKELFPAKYKYCIPYNKK
jgi:RHS repeat-associated protein